MSGQIRQNVAPNTVTFVCPGWRFECPEPVVRAGAVEFSGYPQARNRGVRLPFPGPIGAAAPGPRAAAWTDEFFIKLVQGLTAAAVGCFIQFEFNAGCKHIVAHRVLATHPDQAQLKHFAFGLATIGRDAV